MTDMSVVIINNIQEVMHSANINQNELAEKIQTTRHAMSKMLAGACTINAIELQSIAVVLHVSTDVQLSFQKRKLSQM